MTKTASLLDIPRKRGRPCLYRPEIAQEICSRLATGETLRAISRDDHMPPESTVRQWVIDDHEGFAAHYARARNVGLDCMADKVLSVAADGSGDDVNPETGKINQESFQRSRLHVDALKWYLSKLAPKRYGDRLETRHVGPEGGAIRFTAMSDEELNLRHAELLESAVRETIEGEVSEKKEDSE